jgi:hypothetical protein
MLHYPWKSVVFLLARQFRFTAVCSHSWSDSQLPVHVPKPSLLLAEEYAASRRSRASGEILRSRGWLDAVFFLDRGELYRRLPSLYMLGGWRQTCLKSFKDGPWEPLLSPCFQSSVFQEHRRRNLLYSCRCRHRVQVG